MGNARIFLFCLHRGCRGFLCPDEKAKQLLVFSPVFYNEFFLESYSSEVPRQCSPCIFFHKLLFCSLLVNKSFCEEHSLHGHSLVKAIVSGWPLGPSPAPLADSGVPGIYRSSCSFLFSRGGSTGIKGSLILTF